MASATRESLGENRLTWLSSLQRTHIHQPFGLVHATPKDLWHAPGPEASDADLESVYESLGQHIAVYGHVHRPYLRSLSSMIIANTGSVGLPYDGDPRASYLLIDDRKPLIRRVEYNVDKEIKALSDCSIPHTQWVVRMLQTSSPQMP